MGMCSSCFKGSTDEVSIVNPPAEMRRKLQQEAAERRRLENENRGIKDPDKVRRQQLRAEEVERREEEAWRSGGGQPNLRWQTT
ncbi:uncharacterized protein LOC119648986 [Hermetia illucens]|nr:uncharacterized protein LOC119648986 [Hermetia illucens]